MPNSLGKEQILSLFNDLNSELNAKKIKGELYLVGGAVMCLALNARESTKDIDAIFEPSAEIRKAAARIATRHGVEENWLNDAVKGFLSEAASFNNYLDLSNLKVFVALPEYLLAMKCLSFRIGVEFADESDVRFLLRYLNIDKYDRAIEIITRYYPKDRFPQKTFYALEEILGS